MYVCKGQYNKYKQMSTLRVKIETIELRILCTTKELESDYVRFLKGVRITTADFELLSTRTK